MSKSDDFVRTLARVSLETGVSYSKLATEHGVGKGRIKKFIDEIQSETFDLSEVFKTVSMVPNNVPKLGRDLVVTFEDGTEQVLRFKKEVVDIRQEGAII